MLPVEPSGLTFFRLTKILVFQPDGSGFTGSSNLSLVVLFVCIWSKLIRFSVGDRASSAKFSHVILNLSFDFTEVF